MSISITTELIIDTRNLDFGFNKTQKILKNLSLKVEKGSIYGFLGPNGAGKTTTIRLLLGLLKVPEKSIRIFGKELALNRTEIFSRTGSLIETPSLYEHISGYDNLKITASIRKVGDKRIKEILELVRLFDAAFKKVGSYSLGMKQRLGLGIALIAQPELLILDEPVNGLDPNGIVEIRELLKSINRELGTTIFLSSHMLSEIERMVTHIGIINMGELLYQGTISDLREKQMIQAEFHIETNNNKAALNLLRTRHQVVERDNALIIKCSSREQASGIIRDLVVGNISIYSATYQNTDLEQLFLQLTGNYKVS